MVLASACDGGGSNTPVDAGDVPEDGSTSADAGTPPGDGGGVDADVPAGELLVERTGARVFGPALALTRLDRELYVGTITIPDPARPDEDLRGGLVRLDLDDADATVFDDELPLVDSPWGGRGPVSTAGAARDGDRTLVVAQVGLLVGTGGAFELTTLPVDGADASPSHLALDRADGDARLWVATDRGLLLLDADTLAIERVFGPADIGGDAVGSLAVDPSTRALYAVSYDTSTGDSHLARVALGASPEIVELDTRGEALSGRIAELAWSDRVGGLVFTVSAFDPAAGGLYRWAADGSLTVLATEGQLARAARGEAIAFGASALAVDDTDGVIVVGGSIRPSGGSGILIGGGIAWVDATRLDEGVFAAGLSTTTSDLRGDFVAAVAYDPVTHRTFASLRQPCSEVRLGNAGLSTITFEAGQPVLEASMLSGVRDLALLDGELVAALRDDSGGAACEGVAVQAALVGVRGSGTGAALDMQSIGGDGEFSVWRTTRIAANRLAFADPDHRLVVSYRNDVYIGGDRGHTYNPALGFGISLDQRAVAWLGSNRFAIGGGTSHDEGDPDNIGPHGAAIVEVGDDGRILGHVQYVRSARTPSAEIVEGLPSNEVWDLVPGPDGSVYVICGLERLRRGAYDRTESAPYLLGGVELLGGIARITDRGAVEIVATGAHAPDPRAAAFDASGDLLVLDARRGLLRVAADGAVTEEALPIDPPETSIPTSLWVGEDALVATFSTGAVVQIGDASRFVDGVGWTWRALEEAPGVLAIGTDEGIVEVRLEGTTAPAHQARANGGLPTFSVQAPVDPPGGSCLPVGTPCAATPEDCCEGLTCGGGGFVLECVRR